MRIALAQMNPTIGALQGNLENLIHWLDKAEKQGANLVLTPELALTGYPPQDFLLLPHFIHEVEKSLLQLVNKTRNIALVVGLPRYCTKKGRKCLHNSAAILYNREIIGYYDKWLLPTYDVFDESRYFESGTQIKLWDLFKKKFSITICEDIWQHTGVIQQKSYQNDPIREIKELNPDIVLNLSASPYSTSKRISRNLVAQHTAQILRCPVAVCNQVGGNGSLIYDGNSLYIGSDGAILGAACSFKEDLLVIDTEEVSEPIVQRHQEEKDLYTALVVGVKDYFRKSQFSKACLGISGGIDSALTACIAADALGQENVLGIAMPSRYSSEGSVSDAQKLAQNLGIQYREVPIENPFNTFLELFHPFFEGKEPDVTEENLQARIRGMILMAFSNKFGYIVLSTGNKSELAMGYSTLYGDMCGGLGVISDVTKMQVYQLARWVNRETELIPWNTLHKPPSAELRPNQKDSDSLPDYKIIDDVVREYVENHQSPETIVKQYGYDESLVRELIVKIHRNEYKRRQSPPGLRVSEKAFTEGRRFPIVQGAV